MAMASSMRKCVRQYYRFIDRFPDHRSVGPCHALCFMKEIGRGKVHKMDRNGDGKVDAREFRKASRTNPPYGNVAQKVLDDTAVPTEGPSKPPTATPTSPVGIAEQAAVDSSANTQAFDAADDHTNSGPVGIAGEFAASMVS